jgi:hypothetical protein
MYRKCWFNLTVFKNIHLIQSQYDNKTRPFYLRMTFDADPDGIASITNTLLIVR